LSVPKLDVQSALHRRLHNKLLFFSGMREWTDLDSHSPMFSFGRRISKMNDLARVFRAHLLKVAALEKHPYLLLNACWDSIESGRVPQHRIRGVICKQSYVAARGKAEIAKGKAGPRPSRLGWWWINHPGAGDRDGQRDAPKVTCANLK